MSNTHDPDGIAPEPSPPEELDTQRHMFRQPMVDLDHIQGSASLLTAVRAYDRAYQERLRQCDERTDEAAPVSED